MKNSEISRGGRQGC